MDNVTHYISNTNGTVYCQYCAEGLVEPNGHYHKVALQAGICCNCEGEYTPDDEYYYNVAVSEADERAHRLEILLSCIKSASRAQAKCKMLCGFHPDSESHKDEWLAACNVARGYEKQIKELFEKVNK